MNVDPYEAGKIPAGFWDRVKKKPVTGEIVVVLGLKLKSRELDLIKQPTRVINRDEVHELIATDEDAAPGRAVNNILYLGFFEVAAGGVIVVGDDLSLNQKHIGKLAGFNEIHAPNHINIVFKADQEFAERMKMRNGDGIVLDLPMRLGDKVTIERN